MSVVVGGNIKNSQKGKKFLRKGMSFQVGRSRENSWRRWKQRGGREGGRGKERLGKRMSEKRD